MISIALQPGHTPHATTGIAVDRTFGIASGTPLLAFMLHGLVAFLVFSGFFVLFEPAPYEILAVGVLILFFLFGVPVHGKLIPLVLLMMSYLAFGFLTAVLSPDPYDGLFYITVTTFLGITGILFAIYVANNPLKNGEIIKKAYIAACVVAAFFGILGYLAIIPGSEVFTLYSRAKGTFEDPNVFGPFLVIGALFCFHAVLIKPPLKALFYLCLLFFITLGIFLSFSRGSWAMLVVCGGLMTFLMFLTSPDARQRFKIAVLFGLACAGAVVLIIAALSIEQVADIFAERAQLVQEYDAGHEGRFSRHWRGLIYMLEHPFGLGQGIFSDIFSEDPHNVYLKAFAVHGWGGATAYIALIGLTLYKGTLLVFTPSPLQRCFLPFFVAFVGLALLGWIIDIDRWRFHYLILGCVWGMLAVADAKIRMTMRKPVALSPQMPSR